MRDVKRIRKFCNNLADVWEQSCPDWRFGQLMSNVLGKMMADGRDCFFPEEPEMLEYFKNFFNKKEGSTGN